MAKDRSHWVVRKCDSFDEMRRLQIADWQACSGEERRRAAWELARDYWIDMKGKTEDELRLQRTVGHAISGRG